MQDPTLVDVVPKLVDALIDCPEGDLRDRVLLDAVVSAGLAPAAGLWRATDAGDGSWHAVLSRGPAELLPDAERVRRAVAGGPTDASGPTDAVLVAGSGPRGMALALGGRELDEERRDVAAALLEVWAVVEASGAERGATLDAVAAPLPRRPLPGRSLPGDEARGLVHDLRELMAGLGCTAGVLRELSEELADDERLRYGEAVDLECRRAGDLVARALAPSSPEASPAGDARGETLAAVLAALEPALDAEGIELGVRVEPPPFACALAEEELARLVRNLVENAREALSGRGGRIAVEWFASAAPGLGSILCVRDDGPGFPADVLAGEHPARAAGHGLGLAQTRERVRLAGGHLDLKNLPARGACVQASFPPAGTIPGPESPL